MYIYIGTYIHVYICIYKYNIYMLYIYIYTGFDLLGVMGGVPLTSQKFAHHPLFLEKSPCRIPTHQVFNFYPTHYRYLENPDI